MVAKYIILPLLLLVIMGVSVAGSVVSSTWTISNETDATINDFVFPVKVSTEALLDGGLIGTDGLKWETVDGSDDEVPFAPSPSKTVVKACGLGLASDTDDCQDAGTADVAIFTATGSDLTAGEDFLFGGYFQFTRLELHIDTAGVFATDPDIVWEYCTAASGACTTWATLPGIEDDTDGFTKSGVNSVSWDIVPLWVESTDITAITAFYVRARVGTTVLNANYTTQALADLVNADLGVVWVYPCDPCDDSAAPFSGAGLLPNDSYQFSSHLGISASRTQHRMIVGGAGITQTASSPGSADFAMEFVAGFKVEQTGSARRIFEDGDASHFIELSAANNFEVIVDFGDCDITAPTALLDDRLWTLTLVYENGVQCELFRDAASVGSDASISGPIAFTTTMEYFKDESTNYVESVAVDFGDLVITGTPNTLFENDDLTTFTTLVIPNQGSGADGTPSFPLWVDGVVGTATAFLPPTVIGRGADVTQPDTIGALSPIEDFVATPVTITLPGAEAIDELFDYDKDNPGQEIPSIAFWYGFGAILTIVTLIVAFKATGNILFTMLAVGAVMAIFVSLTIFSIWQVFVFAVIGAGIVFVGRGIVSSV